MKPIYFSMTNGFLKPSSREIPYEQIPFKDEFIRTIKKKASASQHFLKSAAELEDGLRLSKTNFLGKKGLLKKQNNS